MKNINKYNELKFHKVNKNPHPQQLTIINN